jgi:hypothetical protein
MDEKNSMLDKSIATMEWGFLVAWLGYMNDFIVHGPWVPWTAFLVFCTTIGHICYKAARRFYLWRKGRFFETKSEG